VLYLAWLLVLGVVGMASVFGVSQKLVDAKVAERFAQIVGCHCTQKRADASRRPPRPQQARRPVLAMPVVLPAKDDMRRFEGRY